MTKGQAKVKLVGSDRWAQMRSLKEEIPQVIC